MDSRLIAWGRGVKRRQPGTVPLWFFTDERRAPDPLPVIKRLPRGLCGVLLRHDAHPNRAALARAVARLCRARGLSLIIAGDERLARALKAGLHLRGGQRLGRGGGLVSASVHNAGQLKRARRAGAGVAFISPVFPTASHHGAPGLGGNGWRRLARQAGRIKPFALGGITGRRVRSLGAACAGVGAIDAFL